MTILVTGCQGMLGSALMDAARREGLDAVGLSRGDGDISDRVGFQSVLAKWPSSTLINCAGIVKERIYGDVTFNQARNINTLAPLNMAEHVKRLVQISTDCVFTGHLERGAYTEESSPDAQDAYGLQKREGEVSYPPHLTLRLSFIGLGRHGLLAWLLRHDPGDTIPCFQNWLWNGWTVRLVAPLILQLAQREDVTGVAHLPGPSRMTKGLLLEWVIDSLGLPFKIERVQADETKRMILDTIRPDIKDMLGSYLTDWSAVGMMAGLAQEYHAWARHG